MSRIYEDLDMIRKRPGMYLGALSVSKMRTFLDGYRLASYKEAEWIDKIPFQPLPFGLFNTFVAMKYQVSGSIGWSDIILEQVAGDEKDGLELFWQLLDEFQGIKTQKYLSAVLSPENLSYHEAKETVSKYNLFHSNKWIPIYKDAEKMHKLVLAGNRGVLLVAEYEEALCVRDIYERESQCDAHIERNFGKVRWQESFEQMLESKMLVSDRSIEEDGTIVYWFG